VDAEGDPESGDGSKPVYHRLESPTQPPDIVFVQQQTGTIRGYPAMGSFIPKVKAYGGPLPQGARGIEFTTGVPPDDGSVPSLPVWSGPRRGVRVSTDDQGWDFAEIDVTILKESQI
jgi:hypothetical protein